MTSDNLMCLPEVANCLTYLSSTLLTTELICYSCKQGYYLDEVEKKCVLGNINLC